MLEKLKIAKQAVEENGLIEAMQCFHFYGRRVQATSSRVTIDCFSEMNNKTAFSVNASKFLTIIDIVGDKYDLDVEGPYVYIKSDKYSMKVEGLKEAWGLISQPRFTKKDMVQPGLIETLKKVAPFTSKDASKPELCSVLFDGGTAYAMSYSWAVRSATIIEQRFSIPHHIIPLILSLGMDPYAIKVEENAVFFFYEDSTWLKYTPYSQGWPAVQEIFENLGLTGTVAMPDDFGQIIHNIVRVVKLSSLPIKAIIFDANGISSNDESCVVNWNGMSFGRAVFSCDVIETIAENCTRIDVSRYPDKMPFTNPESGLEGVVMGMELL